MPALKVNRARDPGFRCACRIRPSRPARAASCEAAGHLRVPDPRRRHYHPPLGRCGADEVSAASHLLPDRILFLASFPMVPAAFLGFADGGMGLRRPTGPLRTPRQKRREFLFCIEHAPLHRSDRKRSGGRDLVVFPLFDKAQRHDFAFPRIEKSHPGGEFECRSGDLSSRCPETFRQLVQRFGVQLPPLPGVVPVQSVLRNSKQPGTESIPVSQLSRPARHTEHHFLRKIFRERALASARPIESQ